MPASEERFVIENEVQVRRAGQYPVGLVAGTSKSLVCLSLLVMVTATPVLAEDAAPPHGAEWELVRVKRVRHFVPGAAPPAGGSRVAPGGEGAFPIGWELAASRTVRQFVPGGEPPDGGRNAASDTEAARSGAGSRRDSTGEIAGDPIGGPTGDPGGDPRWELVRSRTLRHFVPGVPPGDGFRRADFRHVAPDRGRGSQSLPGSGAAGSSDPLGEGWELARTRTQRYFAPGDLPPSGTVPAAASTEGAPADPLADRWLLDRTRTVRSFVPRQFAPPEAAIARGSEAQKGEAPRPSAGWFLDRQRRVRHFVSAAAETILGRRTASAGTRIREVKVASGAEVGEASKPPMRGPTREAPRAEWKVTGRRDVVSGRTVRSYVTYEIPRYRDIREPYRLADRFKRQRSTQESLEITYQFDLEARSADGRVRRERGIRKELVDRSVPWEDVGPVPDPSLDRVVGEGYGPPTRVPVESAVREELARQRLAMPSDAAGATAEAQGGGIAYSEGVGKGTSAGRHADSPQQRRLTAADTARAAGAGQRPDRRGIDLGALVGLGVLYGHAERQEVPFVLGVARGSQLCIYPIDSEGRIQGSAGACWSLDARHVVVERTAAGSGVTATLSGLSGGGKQALVLAGTFQNRLLGKTYGRIELSKSPSEKR